MELKCGETTLEGKDCGNKLPDQLPTTQLPTTQLPTTQLPTTQLPTTQLPTTQLPTTQLPTTQPPTTLWGLLERAFNNFYINMKPKRGATILEGKDGGNQFPDQLPTTLLGLLERAATNWPTHGIRLCSSIADEQGEFLSYAQLLAEAKVCYIQGDTHK
jgi:hypothetical protein